MASPPTDQLPLRTAATTVLTAKPQFRNKSSSILTDGIVFIGGSIAAVLLVWALWSFVDHPGPSNFSTSVTETKTTTTPSEVSTAKDDCAVNLRHDPPTPNFYDDPNLSYSVGRGEPMKNWNDKRREWLKQHPSFAAGVEDRILLVTGSQPSPCRNPIGDHLLLRFFKNKVDYCRIHGYDIFYNNALLHPEMRSFWAKIPVVKAAMLAHPEAEWIWWVDSDAAFTDMDFKLPLERYREYNLVVHGWANLIYETKDPSWVGLNAGVFLIRNCQWSMDMMEEWASMGPQTPAYEEWGQRLRSTFKDKLFPESDDQSGLIYLMLKGKKRWAERIYLEREYYFEGYWVEIVGTLERMGERYEEMERRVGVLRRRHAEKVSEHYGEAYLERRPFITHFTGCQPCSGDHNQMYSGESCWQGMERALNFADNQVLRSFGFVHTHLLNSSSVSPRPF
ncbi:galactomannan galactosyltransferase 1-like [Macadamia integrifolia]|uniref:galactomannan galactosyltransferase 1-like n=1 Tax=Macadamia integrifolia TaxID=60698 RepID=UPI001C502573|nr:galactomannan galactosyltransferase 1-like [Macadamia integrifolia]